MRAAQQSHRQSAVGLGTGDEALCTGSWPGWGRGLAGAGRPPGALGDLREQLPVARRAGLSFVSDGEGWGHSLKHTPRYINSVYIKCCLRVCLRVEVWEGKCDWNFC